MGELFEKSFVLEIAATEHHVATVILLHGMGETAEHWHKLALRWSWPDTFPHIKFIFPQAPRQPVRFVCRPPSALHIVKVSVHCKLGNIPLTAWFDVATSNDIEGGIYNIESQRRARDYLLRLVEKETNSGIKSERIIVGGFSQGGALALSFSVHSPSEVGGVFSVSGYLPMLPQMKELLYTTDVAQGVQQVRKPTYFISHGTNDQCVKYPWAEWTVEALRDGGNEVDFRTYLRGGHMVRPCTREDLESWLRVQVPYGGFTSF